PRTARRCFERGRGATWKERYRTEKPLCRTLADAIGLLTVRQARITGPTDVQHSVRRNTLHVDAVLRVERIDPVDRGRRHVHHARPPPSHRRELQPMRRARMARVEESRDI